MYSRIIFALKVVPNKLNIATESGGAGVRRSRDAPTRRRRVTRQL